MEQLLNEQGNKVNNEMERFFLSCDELISNKWKEILTHSKLVNQVNSGTSDRRLFALYLIETYHYTSHNAKNQALVGARLEVNHPRLVNYQKFCFEHALEESGHEFMAYHDLKSIGYPIPLEKLPRPLAATEDFINYIYEISKTGDYFQRLGYSYWAENCYGYIAPVLGALAKNMNLTPSMMTFFTEHSDIDVNHFLEIKRMIATFCETADSRAKLLNVMSESLNKMGMVLEAIADEYEKFKLGTSTRGIF